MKTLKQVCYSVACFLIISATGIAFCVVSVLLLSLLTGCTPY